MAARNSIMRRTWQDVLHISIIRTKEEHFNVNLWASLSRPCRDRFEPAPATEDGSDRTLSRSWGLKDCVMCGDFNMETGFDEYGRKRCW